ncbi:hypothetical protein ScPMuIL_018665 [Solemya velum]
MSKYFKSYLNHSESDLKLKKSTFTSYIEEEAEDNIEVVANASAFFLEDASPPMLPGECLLQKAESALKFTPFTDRKKGISGSLFVTNFKISFMTSDRSSYIEQNKHHRNLLLEEHDIPLTGIDSVYQISSGRKKRVTPGSVVSDSKLLQICCKDLQVHTFGFSSKQDNKKVTLAIVQHAFPIKANLLFAYDYGRNIKSEGTRPSNVPFFENQSDWEEELRRQRCDTKWWVTDVNRNFSVCTSLPPYFVVPSKVLNGDLCKAAPQFVNSRLPTWCYTHRNGRSLIRMANLLPETSDPQQEARLLKAFQKADNSLMTPAVMDIEKLCPSLKDVQSGFEKLKELSMIDNSKDFAIQDLDWFSALENTHWLDMVLQCLKASNHVTSVLQKDNQTVVIQEHDSRNFSCIVSSLVQILLDPYFRSKKGFEALVQREWVMLGHPFQTNLGFVKKEDTEPAPLFLLFLDSLWQIMQQFPACFEFTETYLITLWDSTHIGLFDTFLFDSYYEKTKFWSSGNCLKRCRLPSIWNWKLLFCDEDVLLFNNPIYIIEHESVWTRTLKNALSSQTNGAVCLRDEMYAKKMRGMYEYDQALARVDITPIVLTPNLATPLIKLWDQFYLRWQVPAQIVAGGNPSRYLQQCLLVDEIIALQHKIESIEEETMKTRPKSGLIFGHACDVPQVADLLRLKYLSSSFPFYSSQTSVDNRQYIQTPLIVYLQNSTIDYNYDNCDDD